MGRLTVKNIVMSYLYTQSVRIDEEENLKRNFCRYHNCDEVDYTELIIAKARRDLINEIIGDIMNLIKVTDPNCTK